MSIPQYIIVLDVETGGLSAELHPITQFACQVVDPSSFKTVESYDTYVKPYNNLVITQGALKASQIDMQDLDKGITAKELVKKIKEIFDRYTTKGKFSVFPIICGHNVKFDQGMLRALFVFLKDDFDKYVDEMILCTQRLMKQREAANKKKDNEIVRYRLSDVCERLGIELKSAHGAPADVEATKLVIKRLLLAMRGEIATEEDKQQKTVKTRNFFQFQLKKNL